MEINGSNFVLSPSKVNLFTDCKRCFYLDVHGLWKRPRAPFPSLPNGMDRILKNHFDYYRENGGVPEEIKEIEDVSLHISSEFEVWRGDFQGIRYKHPSGLDIMGIVDDMLEKDGKLLVLDFKTKGSPPHENSSHWYENQMNFYVYLLKKNGYEVNDFAYLLFYYPEEVLPTGEVKFGTKLVKIDTHEERVESIIEDINNLLEGDIPLDVECDWCHWFGNANNSLDKSEKKKPRGNISGYL